MESKRKIKYFGWAFILVILIIMAEFTGFLCMKIFSPETKHREFFDSDYFKIRKMLMGGPQSNTTSRFISLPYYPYTPNPEYSSDGFVQHNEQGYRGKPVPVKKNGKFRILCLGGSTTYGTTVSNPGHTYPAQLEEILNEWNKSGKLKLSEQGAEVINGGIEGATSAEELTHYLFKFRYYQPDLLVIHSGGNDALIDLASPDFQPDYTHFRRLLFHLEPLPSETRWLLNSYFISFVTIHFFYSDFVKQEHYFSHAGRQRFIRWMDEGIVAHIEGDEFDYYPFHRNHSTLLDIAKADSCVIINLSFALNPNNDRVKSNETLRSLNNLNNTIIQQLSLQKGVHFLPYHYDSISNAAYWIDDCHLNENGEREKARMVANEIFYIYRLW